LAAISLLSITRLSSAGSGTWDGSVATSGDTYETGGHWVFGSTDRNPQVGDSLTIGSGISVFQPTSVNTNLTLSNSSGDGQSMTVNGGELETLAPVGQEGNSGGCGLALSFGASLEVGGTGQVGLAGEMAVGFDGGSSASVTVGSGGSLAVGENLTDRLDPTLYDGFFGNGLVTQTGGTVSSYDLAIGGLNSSASGNYQLQSGTLTVTDQTYVGGTSGGATGAGTLNISGGTFTTGTLQIWNPGSLTVSSGVLAVGTINQTGGVYNQTGGSVTVGTANFSNSGSFSITGGSMTLGSPEEESFLPAETVNTYNGTSTTALTGVVVSGAVGGQTPSITLQNGGQLYYGSESFIIGNSGGVGEMTVTGNAWMASNSGYVGVGGGVTSGVFYPGSGTLTISNGGLVQSAGQQIANTYNGLSIGVGGGQGTVNVSDSTPGETGLLWEPSYGINVGIGGFSVPGGGYVASVGNLNITNGGWVGEEGQLVVGESGGVGTVTVDGAGSILNTSFGNPLTGEIFLAVYAGATGTLNVTNGGEVESSFDYIGEDGDENATALITGAGSTWSTYQMTVGYSGEGGAPSNVSLTVGSGGTLSVTTTLSLGNQTNSTTSMINLQSGGTITTGALTVVGSPSAFNWTGGTLDLTAGNLTVGAGGTLGTSLTLSPGKNLTIANGYGLTVSGTLTLTGGGLSAALTIPSGGSVKIQANSPTTYSLGSLSITGNGTLDITNNRLFIDYGTGPDPIASIAQWITNGFYGLSGPQIISSAIATADTASGLSYGIGYADGADGIVAGLPSGEIEIMFTLLGDANLDGTVNAEDYTSFSHNIGQSGMYWDDGDFNYDGTVNAEDYTLFSHNIGQSAVFAASPDDLESANDINFTNVPEPAISGMIAMSALGILRRRRRPSLALPTKG
jgi:T5SS/PEP-CTERM-associated repeat protein